MKVFILSLIPLLALTAAEPLQGQQCQVKYETVYTKQCATSFQKSCQTSSKTKYETQFETECQTTTRKHCVPEPRSVMDQECTTSYEEICTKDTQQTTETKYVDQCQDIIRQVCQQPPVITAYPAVPIGYGLGGRSAGAARSPAASTSGASDQSGTQPRSLGKRQTQGSAPICTQVKETQCNKVAIQVPNFIEVPTCSRVPKEECRPVERVVLDTKCTDVPSQKCAQIPKQVAIQVPIEICTDTPQEKCADVPKQVPRKTCKAYGPASAPVNVPVPRTPVAGPSPYASGSAASSPNAVAGGSASAPGPFAG